MADAYRVLALTERLEDPATRYRIGLHVPTLRGAGVETEMVYAPRKLTAEVLGGYGGFDAIVIQRRLFGVGTVKRLRQIAKRLVFDFDDAVVYGRTRGGRVRFSLNRYLGFRAIMARCDAVTAGNAWLAELAGRYAAKEKIFLLPTVLDLGRYGGAGVAERRIGEGPVVGWIGQASTMGYLKGLHGALLELTRVFPGLELRVISDQVPDFLPGVRVKLVRWSEGTEVASLQGLDVGLAPLADDKWTRGKCGLRLLQYMAAGVPAVASPVGVQAGIVREMGALPAVSGGQWVASVRQLIEDRGLRAKVAAKGRALVQERYTAEACAKTVLKAWCDRGP